jgi:predicted PolB exonuclease-like 3'-5' exonuclease
MMNDLLDFMMQSVKWNVYKARFHYDNILLRDESIEGTERNIVANATRKF